MTAKKKKADTRTKADLLKRVRLLERHTAGLGQLCSTRTDQRDIATRDVKVLRNKLYKVSNKVKACDNVAFNCVHFDAGTTVAILTLAIRDARVSLKEEGK